MVRLFSEEPGVVSTGDRNIGQILKTKWWQYLLMGLADVEANYTVVKAYQFTTLTSIQVREKKKLLPERKLVSLPQT